MDLERAMLVVEQYELGIGLTRLYLNRERTMDIWFQA